MKSKILLAAIGVAAVSASIAHAEVPVKVEPQVGLSVTHHFGSRSAAPATELGFRFNYSDSYANAYRPFTTNDRPPMLNIGINREGVSKLDLYGVNALMPKYMLAEGEESGSEEGGFLSRINYGLVGMVVLAGGIYYASENYRDDREADRERAEQN